MFYTGFLNSGDFVSGVVPVTKESDEDQKNLIGNYPDDDWAMKKAKDVRFSIAKTAIVFN